jgi:hypothetical protein
MAAGDSSTSICNLALVSLGESLIVSVFPPDARKAAILCNALYHSTRRELLRMQPWNFAKRQAILAASATAPAFTYDNAYPVPADFIRMYDEPETDDPDYELMNLVGIGQCLCSNDDSPFEMLYVYDCQDETQFDPQFVQALATKLAVYLASAMTQSLDKKTEMKQNHQAALDAAALTSAQENSSREFDDDIWLRARN